MDFQPFALFDVEGKRVKTITSESQGQTVFCKNTGKQIASNLLPSVF